MTPEAQRIAIAEACGWKKEFCNHHDTVTWHSPMGICADGDDYPVLPSYLEDLNEMHEAEGILTWAQQLAYEVQLSRFTNTTSFGLLHTTAAQRAEAFLRTIGKWEETK